MKEYKNINTTQKKVFHVEFFILLIFLPVVVVVGILDADCCSREELAHAKSTRSFWISVSTKSLTCES